LHESQTLEGGGEKKTPGKYIGKMLSQHFSINIFLRRVVSTFFERSSTFLWGVSSTFFNIFHKNVDQHFLKMLQHFSEKKSTFFSLLPPSAFFPDRFLHLPLQPAAHDSGGRRHEPLRDGAELAVRQHVGGRAWPRPAGGEGGGSGRGRRPKVEEEKKC
jgi:hypothetical protein